jgi:hypothetical protein
MNSEIFWAFPLRLNGYVFSDAASILIVAATALVFYGLSVLVISRKKEIDPPECKKAVRANKSGYRIETVEKPASLGFSDKRDHRASVRCKVTVPRSEFPEPLEYNLLRKLVQQGPAGKGRQARRGFRKGRSYEQDIF